MNKKTNLKTKTMLIIFFIFLIASLAQSQPSKCVCNELESQLLIMSKRAGGENKAISKLFQNGDECIDYLISTLNGSEFQISIAAQESIRYLGNEKGLKALDAWNTNNKKYYPVWGPVPVPIMEFDYDMIDLYLLGENNQNLGLILSPYIYALAIDKESTKSKILFQKVMKKLELFETGSATKLIANRLKNKYPLKSFSSTKSIENTVLKNSFFVSEEDMEFTTAVLLSFNGKKDKALVEINISRGILAEEWYHVVVKKVGNDWELFSIKFIRQS